MITRSPAIATCEALLFPVLVLCAFIADRTTSYGERFWDLSIVGGFVASFLFAHGILSLARKGMYRRILVVVSVVVPFVILSYCHVWHEHGSEGGHMHRHIFWDGAHIH
jgi:hypothetical protein